MQLLQKKKDQNNMKNIKKNAQFARENKKIVNTYKEKISIMCHGQKYVLMKLEVLL